MTSGAAGGSASAGHSVNFAKLKRNADRSEDAVAVWPVTGITAAIHTTNTSARAGGSALRDGIVRSARED